MPPRSIDWEGYRGMTRLLLLAIVLAVVLWWAVAITGPRRPLSKPARRPAETPPPVDRVPSRIGSYKTTVGENVSVETDKVALNLEDVDEDYWPDIIDA
jgi:hypothetical protein